WSEAKKLPDGILGPIKNKPVQLADGTIICPTSTETSTKPSAWRVHFESSKDGGQTWSTQQPASHGDPLTAPLIDAIQPSILFLGGDKLMALGRSKQKRIFSVTSDDHGESWGTMSLLNLPNPNSGTDALTLKDGRHVLIYNHTERGRSPLNVAVSTDGQNWSAALVLEDEPKAEFSYPAVIQSRDGLIHFTYTWKRKLAKHVVVDPAKLMLKPIVEGRWPE
ncbi:MAG: sialidase family protein, partial [Prosthecobacter sp.]|nr:sialidase family protein [Prosthecobacter sp.]